MGRFGYEVLQEPDNIRDDILIRINAHILQNRLVLVWETVNAGELFRDPNNSIYKYFEKLVEIVGHFLAFIQAQIKNV